MTQQGSCHCGAIRYEVEGTFDQVKGPANATAIAAMPRICRQARREEGAWWFQVTDE